MIAEPTPQKQKAACSSGEPHKGTKAFQRIWTTKENRNTKKTESSELCSVAKVDYTTQLCRVIFLFVLVLVLLAGNVFHSITFTSATKRVIIFSALMWPVPLGWEAEGSVRSALTLYHCEAKEVQLFDSKKLCHTIENILPSGLWLEQVKRQRSPYSTCIHNVQKLCGAAKTL